MFLEPIFQPFSEAYPEIELDVVLDDRPVDIVAEGFDATLRLGELIEQDMVGIKLGPELRQIPAASPRYLERYGYPETPYDLEITAVSTGAGQARSTRIAGNSSVILSGLP
ncbi:LysR substrate-binding domain-containing protein [Pseudomonas asuensis]